MPARQFIKLREDEKIVLMVRRYWLTYFWWGVAIFVLLVGPFFFLFPLMSMGNFGKFVFGASLFLGVFFWIRLRYLWKRNCLIVTNKRIVDVHQKGLTKRSISEAQYERVADISHVVHGVIRVVFNYGTLNITCGDGSVKLHFANVKNPKEVHHILAEMLERHLAELGGTPSQRRRNKNKKMSQEQIEGMTEDELEAVASIVLSKLEEKEHEE